MSKLLSAAAFSQVGNDMQQLVCSVSRSSETNETTVGRSSLGRLKYVEILINIGHCLIMLDSIYLNLMTGTYYNPLPPLQSANINLTVLDFAKELELSRSSSSQPEVGLTGFRGFEHTEK